ncbi:MAG: L,D-transpeptidase [Variibacter sp.]|nr:L,D-transpeptidase [Variibacter sp.]
MSRLIQTAAAASLAACCLAAPASAQSNGLPFFFAPFVQPAQPAYVPATAYAPETQYEERASRLQQRTGSPTRELVAYNGHEAAGTIVINTNQRRLYYVLGGGRAIRYAIGVGREGFQWSGTQTISNKQEWPEWRPPADMIRRRPDLPRWMAGGPHNPLGARAMYLGSTLYRIHGSNEPETIGHAVSSGCIRMLNEDVVDLYDRVKVGTRVVVLR